MGLAIIGFGTAIDAIRFVRLYNGNDRTIFVTVQVSKEPGNAATHGTDTCLQEDVGGLYIAQLLHSLSSHGGVALHDPAGNILIAVPCSILYHDPAIFLGVGIG